MDIKQKHKLKKFIGELESIRGRHTELVSVYVPAGYDLNKVIGHLAEEQGTASNIKDKKTRQNVIDSLERCIRHLRLFKRTPENGLAIFAGNTDAQEQNVNIQIWSVEPPVPLKTRIYRCDQVFQLDILKNMLESTEVYALIVMDRRGATLGLLRGTSIEEIYNLTSGVPGKFKTGGQCLSPDSLIMLSNGDLIEIKDAHNPLVIISENFNAEKSEETPIITKWKNNKELFKVTTYYPKLEIESSKDHIFFVRTDNGIEEKPLSELKEGDYLVMPEKIDLDLPYQKLDFKAEIKSTRNLKKVVIPEIVNEDFARLLGYYLGDGSYEVDRLTFFEQRKEVAEYYKTILEKVFGINTKLSFRKSKNYWQLRIYSRVISRLFNQIFGLRDKTLSEKIPSIILRSPSSVLASFIAGFFDAEGYVSSNKVALGVHNEYIIRQLQFCLLRLGIISSCLSYDNRKNPYSDKVRYTLSIGDIESFKNFKKLINFSSLEKLNRLDKFIENRSNHNKIRQIVVNGRDVARILRNSGYETGDFNWPDFFTNKKQMNKELFKKRIIDKVKDECLKQRLMLFYNSNLIVVKISKIESLGIQETIDIETKNHNFVANGLVVHNSAARFSRIRENMAKEFYRRISEVCNTEFLGMKELKGILVGGPGLTKQEFIDELNEELKRKIIGVEDLTYTDESGLHDLVDKAKDILAEQDIIKEKKIMNKFFEMLAKDSSRIAYGMQEVERALEMGAVEILLLSESLKEEVIEKFEAKAEKTGTDVFLVSVDTREGVQLKDLTGIGAILRYSIG